VGVLIVFGFVFDLSGGNVTDQFGELHGIAWAFQFLLCHAPMLA